LTDSRNPARAKGHAGDLAAGTSALRRARYGNWAVWTFVIPPFGLLLLFVIWPALYVAYLSLLKWDGLGASQFVGLTNYVRILADERFGLALRHNAIWSLGALLFPTLIGLALAILLTRTRALGRGLFQVTYFLPQMISSAIVAVIWRWIYYPNGGTANAVLRFLGLGAWQPQWLADSKLALLAVFIAYCWVANGFSMLIFQAAISSIDESLFEAAQIDGANWWHETRYILLPGIRQALATVLVVTAIWSFQIFDLIYLTTKGGPGDATYVLSIGIYNNTFTYRRVGVGAAWSMVLLVIIMTLGSFMLLRKRNEPA
jgi:raffinose/stachyose/melibiose transport system permease protein